MYMIQLAPKTSCLYPVCELIPNVLVCIRLCFSLCFFSVHSVVVAHIVPRRRIIASIPGLLPPYRILSRTNISYGKEGEGLVWRSHT